MGLISYASNCFHPFGHIIHTDKDIKIRVGGWKGTPEIDTLTIKRFDLKDSIERHLVPPRNVTCPLTIVVVSDKHLTVLK